MLALTDDIASNCTDLTFMDFHIFKTFTSLLDEAFLFLYYLRLEEANVLSEQAEFLGIWVKIFTIYCAIQSYTRCKLCAWRDIFDMEWRDYCEEELPCFHHDKFRGALMQLEDIHGAAVRKQYPTEIWEGLSWEMTTCASRWAIGSEALVTALVGWFFVRHRLHRRLQLFSLSKCTHPTCGIITLETKYGVQCASDRCTPHAKMSAKFVIAFNQANSCY